MRVSPRRQEILEPLGGPAARTLQPEGLLPLELQEEAPSLAARAATGGLPPDLRVPTGEPGLAVLARAAERPLVSSIAQRGYESASLAGLQGERGSWGRLVGCSRRQRSLSPPARSTFSLLASCVAAAVENARPREEAASRRSEASSLRKADPADVQRDAQELRERLGQVTSVQEEERRRIAADVHDRVISQTTGATYEVEACVRAHRGSEELEGRLRGLERLLYEAVERMRGAIYDPWPVTLDRMGLVPALRELCGRQERRTGIRHTLRTRGSANELRPRAGMAVYRVVQEASSDVARHAEAGWAEVSTRFGPRELEVVVSDDGEGFDVRRCPSPAGLAWGRSARGRGH